MGISHNHTFIPSVLSLLPTPHYPPTSRSSQSTRLASLCYLAASQNRTIFGKKKKTKLGKESFAKLLFLLDLSIIQWW